MEDKADAIIKGKLKPKITYYISPLWIKIALILFFLMIVLGAFEIV